MTSKLCPLNDAYPSMVYRQNYSDDETHDDVSYVRKRRNYPQHVDKNIATTQNINTQSLKQLLNSRDEELKNHIKVAIENALKNMNVSAPQEEKKKTFLQSVTESSWWQEGGIFRWVLIVLLILLSFLGIESLQRIFTKNKHR